MWIAVPICFWFERQAACRALLRACAKTGNKMAARIAMMAMTTSSSINVNAFARRAREFRIRIAPPSFPRQAWEKTLHRAVLEQFCFASGTILLLLRPAARHCAVGLATVAGAAR